MNGKKTLYAEIMIAVGKNYKLLACKRIKEFYGNKMDLKKIKIRIIDVIWSRIDRSETYQISVPISEYEFFKLLKENET